MFISLNVLIIHIIPAGQLIEKRIIAHNSGKGAKYTKSRRPVSLVYFEELENKSLALKREHAIKQLTRKQKEDLIRLAKANK